MSMEYIRRTYNVPAKRGARIRYTDAQGVVFNCTITSARGAHLLALVDDRVPGYRGRLQLHPTWNVEYLPAGVAAWAECLGCMEPARCMAAQRCDYDQGTAGVSLLDEAQKLIDQRRRLGWADEKIGTELSYRGLPHFRCVCGTVAMPLTDDTVCKCADIYAQEWTRVEPDGVLGPVHQTKADHTPSDGQESGGGKVEPEAPTFVDWEGRPYDERGEPTRLDLSTPCRHCHAGPHFLCGHYRAAAASVGQAAPDGEGGKE